MIPLKRLIATVSIIAIAITSIVIPATPSILGVTAEARTNKIMFVPRNDITVEEGYTHTLSTNRLPKGTKITCNSDNTEAVTVAVKKNRIKYTSVKPGKALITCTFKYNEKKKATKKKKKVTKNIKRVETLTASITVIPKRYIYETLSAPNYSGTYFDITDPTVIEKGDVIDRSKNIIRIKNKTNATRSIHIWLNYYDDNNNLVATTHDYIGFSNYDYPVLAPNQEGYATIATPTDSQSNPILYSYFPADISATDEGDSYDTKIGNEITFGTAYVDPETFFKFDIPYTYTGSSYLSNVTVVYYLYKDGSLVDIVKDSMRNVAPGNGIIKESVLHGSHYREAVEGHYTLKCEVESAKLTVK